MNSELKQKKNKHNEISESLNFRQIFLLPEEIPASKRFPLKLGIRRL